MGPRVCRQLVNYANLKRQGGTSGSCPGERVHVAPALYWPVWVGWEEERYQAARAAAAERRRRDAAATGAVASFPGTSALCI